MNVLILGHGICNNFYNRTLLTDYRIARNFRGSKLLRIRPKIIFTELIFANFIILPFCTVLFIIFANLKNRENSESYWPRKFPAIQ